VGLKRRKAIYRSNKVSCSNRTTVGLKLEPALPPLARSAVQQSHHCGIET